MCLCTKLSKYFLLFYYKLAENYHKVLVNKLCSRLDKISFHWLNVFRMWLNTFIPFFISSSEQYSLSP